MKTENARQLTARQLTKDDKLKENRTVIKNLEQFSFWFDKKKVNKMIEK